MCPHYGLSDILLCMCLHDGHSDILVCMCPHYGHSDIVVCMCLHDGHSDILEDYMYESSLKMFLVHIGTDLNKAHEILLIFSSCDLF